MKVESKRGKQLKDSYCIRYQNNGSKRWDGKELLVSKEWLEELYPEIYPGKEVQLPWTGKKGKTVLWNAVVVQVDDSAKPSPKKPHLEDKLSEDKRKKSLTKKGKGNDFVIIYIPT